MIYLEATRVMAQTSRSSRRNDGTVKASLGDNINLYGRVATRVVDHTGVDLLDSHLDVWFKFRLGTVEECRVSFRVVIRVEQF